MTYTPIPHGQDNWDVPVNAAFTDQDARITSNEATISALVPTVNSHTTQINTNTANIATNTTNIATLQGQTDTVVIAVDNHGAVGNGTTNDQPVIQGLINSAPKGATVQLGPKQYGLSAPLLIPPYLTLTGPMMDRDGTTADAYPSLVPLAGFTGASVVRLVDKATGSYATENRDVTLRNFNINGVNLTTETVGGIRAEGFVHGVQMYNIGVWGATDHSINLVSNGSGNPYSWYMSNVNLLGNGSVTTWDGFHLIGTDHTLTNCRTLNIRGYGFFLSGLANTRLTACQAEWSSLSGFYITGSYGTAQGSGALILTGCTTDRNSQYGMLIDSTGNPSIVVSGFMARRDGRNGFPGTGGGGFAGLRVSSATTPVVVNGMTCYPGVNDDNTGVNSPERGISVANSTYFQINDSYLHADTLAIHDGGGNTANFTGTNVGTATGTTAAPTRSASQASTIAGPVTTTQGAQIVKRGASTNGAFQSQINSDSQLRFNMNANGDILWGSGTATPDFLLARTPAVALTGKVLTLNRLHQTQPGPAAADNGFQSWNYDPEAAVSTNILTSGSVYLHKVFIPGNVLISNLGFTITTAGATLTAGQSLIGIYDSTGTRLAQSADQSGNWTSTGFKSVALTGSITTAAAGYYYVGIISVGTTPPTIASSNGLQTTFNANVTGATLRHGIVATGATSLAASYTLSSSTSTGVSMWTAAL